MLVKLFRVFAKPDFSRLTQEFGRLAVGSALGRFLAGVLAFDLFSGSDGAGADVEPLLRFLKKLNMVYSFEHLAWKALCVDAKEAFILAEHVSVLAS